MWCVCVRGREGGGENLWEVFICVCARLCFLKLCGEVNDVVHYVIMKVLNVLFCNYVEVVW